jgi:hypothetical protein
MTFNVVQVLDLFLDEATLEDETRPPPSRMRRVTLAVQPPHGVVLPASPGRRQRRRVSFFDVAPPAPESSVSLAWLQDQLEDDDIGNPLGGRSASGTGREWAARVAAMDDEHQVRRFFPGLSMMEEAESDGRFAPKKFVRKCNFCFCRCLTFWNIHNSKENGKITTFDRKEKKRKFTSGKWKIRSLAEQFLL